MKLSLGVGYDTTELNFTTHGSTPAERARFIADALMNKRLRIERGQAVPAANRELEGAVFVPLWAPQVPMDLDPRLATESDVAWAALSGGSLQPTDESEVQECIELMGAWATSRGMWTTGMREEVLARANAALPALYDAPPVSSNERSAEELLYEGARVAFTGRDNLLGGPADDERLAEICEARGLVYKRSVSRTKCDVLVAGDPASMSRKAQAAREFGKPIIPQDEFELWYRSTSWAPVLEVQEKPVVQTAVSPLAPVPESAPDPAGSFPADLIRPADEVLTPGARVSFRGSTIVYGKLITHGEALQQFCSDLGLEYKQSVTKTRCDVLVTDDPLSTDGKNALAHRYGKPMVTSGSFTAWAEARVDELAGGSVPENEVIPTGEVIDDDEIIDVELNASAPPAESIIQEPAAPAQPIDPEPAELLREARAFPVSQAAGAQIPAAIEQTLPDPLIAPELGESKRKRRPATTWALRSLKAVGVLSLLVVIGGIAGFSPAVLGITLLLWMVAAAGAVVCGLVSVAQVLTSGGKKANNEIQ